MIDAVSLSGTLRLVGNVGPDPSQSKLLGKEIVHMDPQSAGQSHKMESRAISHPPFDSGHVAAPNFGAVRERLLRQFPLLAELADSRSQTPEDWMLRLLTRLPWHVHDTCC